MANSLPAEAGTGDFATTFAEAVHVGLDKVLGHSGTEAVLSHMEMDNGFPSPGEFHRRLFALFGERGSSSLERAILKNLATSLKWSPGSLGMEGALDFDATIRAAENGTTV
jgi:hypothetical protein